MELPCLPGQKGANLMLANYPAEPPRAESPPDESTHDALSHDESLYDPIREVPPVAGKKRKFGETGLPHTQNYNKRRIAVGNVVEVEIGEGWNPVPWMELTTVERESMRKTKNARLTLDLFQDPDNSLEREELVLARGPISSLIKVDDVWFFRINHVYWGIRYDWADLESAHLRKLARKGPQLFYFGMQKAYVSCARAGDIFYIVIYLAIAKDWKEDVIDEHFNFLRFHGLLRKKDKVFINDFIKEVAVIVGLDYMAVKKPVEVLKRLPEPGGLQRSAYSRELWEQTYAKYARQLSKEKDAQLARTV